MKLSKDRDVNKEIFFIFLKTFHAIFASVALSVVVLYYYELNVKRFDDYIKIAEVLPSSIQYRNISSANLANSELTTDRNSENFSIELLKGMEIASTPAEENEIKKVVYINAQKPIELISEYQLKCNFGNGYSLVSNGNRLYHLNNSEEDGIIQGVDRHQISFDIGDSEIVVFSDILPQASTDCIFDIEFSYRTRFFNIEKSSRLHDYKFDNTWYTKNGQS